MRRTILVATETAEAVTPPLACAMHLARRYDTDLVVLHVREVRTDANASHPERSAAHSAGHHHAPADSVMHARLEALCAEASGDSGMPTIAIVQGNPWTAILQAARRHHAALTVIGAHRSAAPRADRRAAYPPRMGSTAEVVISHAGCPVAIVNRPPAKARRGFRRILVGIDFSATCELALHFAGLLARHEHAVLHLFHMLPVPPYPKYSRGQYANDKRAARRRLQRLARTWRESLVASCHLWGGSDPLAELLRCAAQIRADLMVLGSHTRERESQWYAGSTTIQAGLRAACPVVVISGPEALAPWRDQIPQGLARRPARERRLQSFRRLAASPNRPPAKTPPRR
jgi:nucleotide-binding universal stress UspA family protein